MSIVLPKIGETITTDRALELCKYFNLDYLVERISNNKDLYINLGYLMVYQVSQIN